MNRGFLIVIKSVLIIYLGCFIGLLVFDKDFHVENFVSEIKIPIYSDYVDNEPYVCYGSVVKCNKIDVLIDADVDTNKLGTYTIIYNYHYGDKNENIIKSVMVVDEEKPIIEYDGDIKACPNGKLLGDNFNAYDDYDGDITKSIVYYEENGKTYLKVSDSSNNERIVEANVIVDNSIKPVITLTNKKVYLLVDRSYSEPGYSAIDPCDGDITDKVVVSSNVNIKKAGNYKINYEVTNSSNNKTSVNREVFVINRNKIIYPSSKTIYLTYDDGPCGDTKKLLDILDEYNVKATFFVTNQFNNNNYLQYIKMAYDRGHSIGVHSYTHDFSIYRSVDAYFNDLNKMNKLIKKLTGEESRLVRFPGGSSNTISRSYKKGIMKTLANELENRGYVYFDWNLGSGDTDGLKTSSKVANNVINQLNNQTKIVLMHDIKQYSIEATRTIIEYGLSKGYSFQALNVNSPTYHHKINN